MYYYVLLCTIMYYYVLLCTIMYYYVLLCTIMYYYVLSCTIMYYYVLLCTIMYYYVLLCTIMKYYVLSTMYLYAADVVNNKITQFELECTAHAINFKGELGSVIWQHEKSVSRLYRSKFWSEIWAAKFRHRNFGSAM